MDLLSVGDSASDIRLVQVRAGGVRDVVLVGLHDQNDLKPTVLHLHAGNRVHSTSVDHHLLLYIHNRVHTRPQQGNGTLQYQHSIDERR